MKIVNRIKIFLNYKLATRLLFVEAFILLGWARMLKNKPFLNIAKTLELEMEETSLGSSRKIQIIRDISSAVNIMSKYTFWESMCLVRAIAAMKMLERRNIESTLYLGTAKDKSGKLIAHAWLRSGSYYLTGAEEMNRFTVVGKFTKKISICNKGEAHV